MILKQYSPESGIMVCKNNSYQKTNSSAYNLSASTGSFNYMSSVINSSTKLYSKNSVDTGWESEYIYFADYGSKKVVKSRYNGTILNSIQLVNPTSLSVIQNSNQMSIEQNIEDQGCWVIDNNSIIRLSNKLEILTKINNLNSPLFIASSKIDYGCFVIDSNNNIFRFFENGDLIGFGSVPSDIIDIKVNSFGEVYILQQYYLFRYVTVNGSISLVNSVYLPTIFTQHRVSTFDIDNSNDNKYIFIAGWNKYSSTFKIARYTKTCSDSHLSSTYTGELPYIIKVSQHPRSSTLYILCDKTKYSDFESSSSTMEINYSDSSFSSSSSSLSLRR